MVKGALQTPFLPTWRPTTATTQHVSPAGMLWPMLLLLRQAKV